MKKSVKIKNLGTKLVKNYGFSGCGLESVAVTLISDIVSLPRKEFLNVQFQRGLFIFTP